MLLFLIMPVQATIILLVFFLQCKHFPVVTKRVKLINNKHKPWITSAILQSVRRKNFSYKRWQNSKSDYRLAKYTAYKNKLTSTIRNAEKMYYSNHFEKVKGDTRKTWGLIRSIINNGVSKADSIKKLKIDNAICTDSKKIADKFNEFSGNIGPKLARKVGHANMSHHDYLVNSVQSSTSMFMNPTGLTEIIINVICHLKGNKSPGYDDISTKAVKAVAQFISNPLSEVFNISIFVGEFPDKLKLAKVIPVYKTDDKLCVNNYRPTSLLSVFSKILERLVYDRLFFF